MTLLSRNTTPAERARGCVFSELFRDGESVARNGGVATGAPAIDKGVTLDGSTQYVDYNLDSGGFDTGGGLSFAIEFDPAFAADDSVRHAIFDCSSTILSFQKRDNNALWVTAGGAVVINVALANYQNYWLVGERNVLVYSGATGANSCWLNGNLIGTSATAFSKFLADDITVGSNVGHSSLSAVTVYDLKIFNRQLTADEAADFYTGDAYGYRNEASLYLPMGAAQDDPTNVRTLDVSGNDRHATFGDGVTPSTYPTKVNDRHGYDFDGSSDYMTTVGTGIFNTAGVTIAIEFWPDFKATDAQDRFVFDSSSGDYLLNHGASGALALKLGGTTVATPGSAAYKDYWRKGAQNIIVIAAVTGSNQIWLNGVKFVDNNTAWTETDPALLAIGINNALTGSRWLGQINSFRVWRQALTPLQIADLTIKAGIQVNDI